MLSPFPLKFIRGVGLLGVFFLAGSVLGLFLYLFSLVFFLDRLLGFFFSGCLFWVFGWATYVYSEALRAFLVFLEAHCTFLIYTILFIKKKKGIT
jgi:hypothetical protein